MYHSYLSLPRILTNISILFSYGRFDGFLRLLEVDIQEVIIQTQSYWFFAQAKAYGDEKNKV